MADELPTWITQGQDRIGLTVKAAPRASRSRVEVTDRELRVYVTAAPDDGRANVAINKLLAKRLGIAKSRLELVRGATSRDKHYEIVGLTAAEVLDALTR